MLRLLFFSLRHYECRMLPGNKLPRRRAVKSLASAISPPISASCLHARINAAEIGDWWWAER